MAKNKIKITVSGRIYFLILIGLLSPMANAKESKLDLQTIKANVQKLFAPESSEDYRTVHLNELSNFGYTPSDTQALPVVTTPNGRTTPVIQGASVQSQSNVIQD